MPGPLTAQSLNVILGGAPATNSNYGVVMCDGITLVCPSGILSVTILNQNTTGTAGNVTGIVGILNGGTGLPNPSLIAGTNVTITGAWPNQTINSSGGGGGSMTWPAAPGIAVYAGSSAWGTSLTAPAGAIVGTTDTQALTNKTLDGVSPATMAFVDPSSSIQTQLNGKQVSGAYLTGNQTITLSGDTTGSGATAITTTTVAVNGTTVPVNSAADQTIVTTGSAVGAWKGLPGCLDSSGNHLNYDTSTHVFSCGTTSSTGAPAFSSITGSTNTTATMVVGTGASLAPTSATAGVLSANQINGTALSGLATGIVKNTTTTGVPSIAVAGDFPTLNQSTTGNALTATTATNLPGGLLGSIPYQSAAATTALLAGNTTANDQVLISHGTGTVSAIPSFTTAPTISAANMTSFPASLMTTSTVLASGQMPTFTGDVTNSGLAMTVGKIGGKTVSLSGNFTTTGAFNPTLSVPSSSTWTLPAGPSTLMSTATVLGSAQVPTFTGDVTASGLALTVGAIGGKTVSLSGNLTTTGAFNPTFAIPSSSTWTYPAGPSTLMSTATVLASGQMPTFTGDVTNSALAMTVGAIGGKTVSLSGNFATTGAFNPTFAIPSSSTWTFPAGPSTLMSTGTSVLAAQMPALTGDVTTSAGAVATTAAKINGTSVPTNSAADQVILTTASSTGSWGSVPGCLDSAGNHLNYNTTSHVFSCGTTSSTAAPTFSAITGSTNTSAAMIVGTGASLTTTSASVGTISANQINATALGGLATGILKNTTTTGVPSIAVAGDFPTLNQSTTGTANLAGGALGSLPYQSAAATTAVIAGNTAATDQVLISHGTGSVSAIPTLSNAPTLSAANMTSFPASLMTTSTVLVAAQEPAHTGDMTNSAGSLATTVGAIGGKTVSLSGNLTTTGAFNPTFAIPSSSTWTFPAGPSTLMSTATVLASAQMPTFTGDVTNTNLAMTVGAIGGKTVSLSGNLATTGAFNPTFAIPSSSTWTFPAGPSTLMSTATVLASAQMPTFTGDVTNSNLAMTVGKINGTSLGGLSTGILKNTTTTGVPSIAVAGDFPTLNQNTTGTANVAGGLLGSIPYQSAVNTTAVLAGNTTANDQVLVSHGTGTISAIPTFSNAPTLSAANLSSFPATVVQTGQANTYTTGGQSFASATSLTVPTAAGAAPTVDGQLADNTTNHTYVWGSNGTALVGAVAATGTGTATTCTNQAVTAVSGLAVPTCTTLTSSYVDTSIAKTGTDINTSNQVTVTHLAAGLPIAQGGTANVTAQAAFDALAPTPTRAGDVAYYNGTHWTQLAGNNAGTNYLQENSTGVPSWAATSGTIAWGAISNPASNLSLTMGSNTTAFNYTTALASAWSWNNTTAAVVGTSQASPPLALCGTGFHASASVTDCLTLQDTPGAGNDAAITLAVGHSGTSTGLVTTTFPGPIRPGPASGQGSTVTQLEGTTAAAASGSDVCYADSTAHTIKCSMNNGTFFNMPQEIAAGTAALGTGAIASGACASVVTSAGTGIATTDVILASFNGDPTGVTGYAPSANGMLTIITYPTANTFNAKVCNDTANPITPGAITLNWRVDR